MGKEECDAGGQELGCTDDCLGIDDYYECEKGNGNTPSKCKVKSAQLQNEAVVQQGKDMSTAISSLSNVLLILTSITQIGTLGPTYFIMIHMQQLLRALVLVGQHSNMYMVEFLQVRFNPLEMIMIPDSWIPDIDFQKRHLEAAKEKKPQSVFQKSGFKIQITLMLIGVLVGQFLLQFLVMNFFIFIVYLNGYAFCQNRCPFVRRLAMKGFGFSLVSFPLRYVTENFLQLWVTLAIEINLLIGSY